MNVRREAGSGDPGLVDAYEGMRRRHGRQDFGGAGHEVLRRQGMASWIEAFAGCLCAPTHAPSPSPHGRTAAPALFAGAGGGWLPVSLYPELTRLVAGLALDRLREGA